MNINIQNENNVRFKNTCQFLKYVNFKSLFNKHKNKSNVIANSYTNNKRSIHDNKTSLTRQCRIVFYALG